MSIKLIFTILFISGAFSLTAQPWNQIPSATTTSCNSGGNINILGIHFVNDLVGYAVGNGGLIQKTIDGGNSWNCQISNTTQNLYSTYFIDANTGFAVGDGGAALRTQDGGINWITITLPSPLQNIDLRCVWFYNAYVGYITGGVSASSGNILRTLDGGISWNNVSPIPNNLDVIYGIASYNGTDFYATDFLGNILTSIGGSLWSFNSVALGINLHGIYFLDSNHGYCVGGNAGANTGIILKTIDGGVTWNSSGTYPSFFTDIKFFGSTGFVVGGNTLNNSNGVIYKTNHNPGPSHIWSPQTTIPGIVPRLFRLSLPCSHTAYACGLNGTILKVDDINKKMCCEDFMTDVMDYGIQGTGIGGNTYQFCLSPNIGANDIVQWDINCDGSPDSPSSTPSVNCANFTLVAGSTELCATVLHINENGDTCRVKVNTCLPEIKPSEPCTCDSIIIDVNAGFTWVQISPYTYTFTPNSLIDNCDQIDWIFGGTGNLNSSGTASVTYTFPSVPGSYNVCMIVTRTEPNGQICKRESCIQLKVTGMVSTDEVKNQKISIKPNPAINSVVISIPDELDNNGNLIRLSTIEGKLLVTTPVESIETLLNIETVPAGLYFVSVTDALGTIIANPTKLVKIK